MTKARGVLLVGAGADLAEALRTLLAREPRVRLLAAPEPQEALEVARRERPALVLVDAGTRPTGAMELIRALRLEPDARDWTLAWIAGAGDPEIRAGEDGPDHVVTRPVTAARLGEVIATAFRRADLEERVAADRLQIEAMEERHAADRRDLEALAEELERNAERVPALLVALLELGIPGALDRGLRTAQLATRIAARFDVPAELVGDLEQAAKLHELGRLVSSPRSRSSGDALVEPWAYAVSTVAILKRAEGLDGTAEVISGLYENWDGTGRPSRWQAGQIPLRCRILRVVVDFIAALERDRHPSTAALLESFEEHAGTLYDPLVLVHLKALLEGRAENEVLGSTVLLPITELAQGMVLAEDLYTDGGLKLLSRDTELTPATLEVILRRHRAEPILQGATVRRSAA
jgi:putative two-component system response regulator